MANSHQTDISVESPLMICDKINVYGFARNWKQRNMRYHYFNREEPNESQMLRDGKNASSGASGKGTRIESRWFTRSKNRMR